MLLAACVCRSLAQILAGAMGTVLGWPFAGIVYAPPTLLAAVSALGAAPASAAASLLWGVLGLAGICVRRC